MFSHCVHAQKKIPVFNKTFCYTKGPLKLIHLVLVLKLSTDFYIHIVATTAD